MGEKLWGEKIHRYPIRPSPAFSHLFFSFFSDFFKKSKKRFEILLLAGLVGVDEVHDVFGQNVEVVAGQVLGLPEAAEGAFADS